MRGFSMIMGVTGGVSQFETLPAGGYIAIISMEVVIRVGLDEWKNRGSEV